MKKFIIRISKLFILIILLVVISSNYITYAASGDTIVYKTRTGEKYHRDGCQYLRKSQIPVRLDEAVYNDNLSPCSRCNPPILDTYSQQPIESTPKIVESYSTTKSTSKTQDEEVSLEDILTKLKNPKPSSSNSKKESSSSNRNVSITTNKSSSSSDDIGIAIGLFIIFSPYIISIFISLYEFIKNKAENMKKPSSSISSPPAVKAATPTVKIAPKKTDNSNICPRCGGYLKYRTGRYGPFWGCSNYPKCTFTRNINKK